MDFVLIFTLIVLHQVTSYLCKPLSELSNEEKAVSAENYTALINIIKDINEQNGKNGDFRQAKLGEKKNVLHMIQLVHKDGRKAPVAIILTPADLASGIANKYDLKSLIENSQKDAIENPSKSKGFNPGNDRFVAKEINLHNIKNDDVVSLPFTNIERLSQNRKSPKRRMKTFENKPKERTKPETTLEYKLATIGDEFDSLNMSFSKEHSENVASGDTANNSEEKEETPDDSNKTPEDSDNSVQNNDSTSTQDNDNTEDFEETLKTETPSNSDESQLTTKAYENDNTTSEEEISKESSETTLLPSTTLLTTTDSTTQESDENTDEDETETTDSTTSNEEDGEINKHESDNDKVPEELLKKNNLEAKVHDTVNPKIIFIDDEKVKEIKPGCAKEIKTSVKETGCNLDTRTYNLSFIFNGK